MSFFNAYYDHHMYHPVLIYDAESGELVTAILRPGKVHASRGVLNIIKRLIKKIRKRSPHAQIVIRGDSAFCVPRILEGIEKLNRKWGDVDCLLGLSKNSALLRLGQRTIELAEELYDRRGEKIVKFSSFSYKARSWKRHRHVVIKAEHTALGRNPRFVITSLKGFPSDCLLL